MIRKTTRTTTALVATMSLVLPQVMLPFAASAQDASDLQLVRDADNRIAVQLCVEGTVPPCADGSDGMTIALRDPALQDMLPMLPADYAAKIQQAIDIVTGEGGKRNIKAIEAIVNGGNGEGAAAADASAAAAADAEAAAAAEAEAAAAAEAQAEADRLAEEQAAAEEAARAEAEAAAQAQAEADVAAAAQAEADAAAAAEAQAEADRLAEEQAAAEEAARAEAEAAAQAQADADAAAAAQAEADAAAAAEAQAEADRLAAEEAAAAEAAAAEQAAQEEAQAAADAAEAEAAAAAQAEADAAAQAEADAAAQAEADAAAQAEADAAQAEADAAAQAELEAQIKAEQEALAAAEAEAERIAAEEAAAAAAAAEQAAAEPAAEPAVEEELTDAEAVDPTVEEAPVAAAAAAAEEPADQPAEGAQVTEQTVTANEVRDSSQDFETAVNEDANADADKKSGLSDFEKALLLGLGAYAIGSMLDNGQEVVANTGDRVIVQGDNGLTVYKNDDALLGTAGSDVRTETYSDGSTRTIINREDGSQVITIRDSRGRVLSRSRVLPDGTRVALIDDLGAPPQPVDVRNLVQTTDPAPSYSISDADYARLIAALRTERASDRTYSLRQIREIRQVRELVPAIDLDSINFATGSAAIARDELQSLVRMGALIENMIAENPREVFLVEGHTDAVGGDVYNLALSDRRAESVALALTEYFDIPPENLVVQGYGEQFLKVNTQTAEQENRRATLRRITPLLAQVASQ